MLLDVHIARKLERLTDTNMDDAWKEFIGKQIFQNTVELETAKDLAEIYRCQAKAILLREMFGLPEFIRNELVNANELDELETLRQQYGK